MILNSILLILIVGASHLTPKKLTFRKAKCENPMHNPKSLYRHILTSNILQHKLMVVFQGDWVTRSILLVSQE